QARKNAEHTLAVFRAASARPAIAAEVEIFAHRHVGEDAAAFGDVDQALRDDRGWARPLNRRALEPDRAAPRPQHAGDGLVERGLSRAVGAEHRDDLVFTDRK